MFRASLDGALAGAAGITAFDAAACGDAAARVSDPSTWSDSDWANETVLLLACGVVACATLREPV
jgi:hypothetical protein